MTKVTGLSVMKKREREKIREVMRFSGPRMLFHHPVAAVRHLIETNAERLRGNSPFVTSK